MERNHLQFGPYQRKGIKEIRYLIIFVAIAGTIMPLGYGATFLTANEPVHQLFQEVLEVDVTFELHNIHILLGIGWLVTTCGGVIFYMTTAVVVSFEFANICFSSLIPQRLQFRHSNKRLYKYHVETAYFGVLEDEEVIHMYRTQQIFNILSNNMVSSLLFCSLQPAIMIILVGLSFVVFKFFHVLQEIGLTGIVLAFSGIFIALLIQFLESENLGMLVEHSKNFRKIGRRFSNRRSLYWKFAVSCPVVYFDVAHPFYKISRETFGEFFQKYLEFLIDLLVSTG
ncbi:unnamed protein product [Orchesella dallaii]|uniref:Uncharacterized protein n=1 Tax=Orchesella dallaii TaxID=48710 RepID=A0ABP1Q4Z5_9HEXA